MKEEKYQNIEKTKKLNGYDTPKTDHLASAVWCMIDNN